MTEQTIIDFSARRYPDRAGFKEQGTSRDAANAIEGSGRAAKLRDAVLGWYATHTGTSDECAAALGESILSIRPRCSELLTKGRLYRTGERRRSSEGAGQAVLALSPKAQEQAE